MGEDGPAGISRKTAIVIEDTEHTYRCFPFLKLPPEIRNRIYELVFVSPNYIGTNGTQTKSFYKDASRWRNLAFAKSCRQIYSESANIFYARNGFEFHYIRPFLEFMEAIGPSRRKLVSKIRYYFLSGRPFIALRYLRSCANLEELEISVKIITKGKKNSWWSYPLKDAKAFLFSKAKIIDFGPIRTFGKAGEVAEENSHIIDLQKRLLASDLAKVRAEMVGIYRRPDLPDVFKEGHCAWKFEKDNVAQVDNETGDKIGCNISNKADSMFTEIANGKLANYSYIFNDDEVNELIIYDRGFIWNPGNRLLRTPP